MDKKFNSLVAKINLLHDYYDKEYQYAYEYENLHQAVEYRAKRNAYEDLQLYIKEINETNKDPVLEMIRESIRNKKA